VDIYIKERKKKDNEVPIEVIKGLLKSMQVAKGDNNNILFDKVKNVISNMAKSSGNKKEEKNGNEEKEDSVK